MGRSLPVLPCEMHIPDSQSDGHCPVKLKRLVAWPLQESAPDPLSEVEIRSSGPEALLESEAGHSVVVERLTFEQVPVIVESAPACWRP